MSASGIAPGGSTSHVVAALVAAVVCLGANAGPMPQNPAEPPGARAIAVGQGGYASHHAKHAMIGSVEPTSFEVRDTARGTTVFTGTLSDARFDIDTGLHVRDADFSALSTPGRYSVHVPGVGRSWAFDVRASADERPLYLALRSYYGQRCGSGVDLGPDFPDFRYRMCHTRGQFDPSSGRSGTAPSVKGWHDAGDYGRYMVTSGITTGMLLLAAELFPARLLSLRLDIPESANATPDLLDEVRWNLEWMQSMQDEDGGVWHKQTSASFPGFVLPHDDTSVSLVVGSGRAPFKTTCATAQFAAATAMASRAFRSVDRRYAATLLHAARRAWGWTVRHPDERFTNPSHISTGEYGDSSCGDDRLWAAVELWRATREEPVHLMAQALASTHLDALSAVAPPSWSSVAAFALWSYALDGRGDAALTDTVRARAATAAAQVADRVRAHPFRQPLTTADYVWGSNGVAATYGVQLLVADRLTGRAAGDPAPLVDTAIDTLHYLLGRNAFSLSWLTHVGANSVRHPHHRPSEGDAVAEPWPGLLAGGPDGQRQDPILEQLSNRPPGLLYADDARSFASNEYAINWNAPLVVLLAGAADAAVLDLDAPSR